MEEGNTLIQPLSNRESPLIHLSVVVALYNEEDNIIPLLKSISEALLSFNYELILVDDGSSDQTVNRLKHLLEPHMSLIVLRKNYGQSAAMAAGIAAAKGSIIATMDGDLQNDPFDLPAMVRILENGEWDLIAGVRQKRKDGWLFRKIPSQVANALIRKTTGIRLHDYGCTLKVFESSIAKNLGLYGQLHRYIPVLAAMQGARMTEMPVRHHPRIHGQSKYGLGRVFKVTSDLVLMVFLQKYFQRPMHLFGPIGFFLLSFGVCIDIYLVIEKIKGYDIGNRPLITLGVILLLSGLQFILFGILSEVMMRTYFESQDKLPYQVREVVKIKTKQF
jgi:glycosyltransferase involved in cell wall biosynthesis